MSKLSADDAIRLFGMSGLLIQDELAKAERQLGIEFRDRRTPRVPEHDTAYYPQFAQVVRDEAAEMARHYEVFYCLERSIRQLVNTRMKEAKGLTWWQVEAVVPQVIRDEVRKNQQRELDSGVTVRSEDPLDYTTFGQLGDIITTNWDVFSDTFSTQRAVQRVMQQLNTLRGPIAHCSPLSEDEIVRLRLSVRDWFRLME